jgi:hypothetical protein
MSSAVDRVSQRVTGSPSGSPMSSPRHHHRSPPPAASSASASASASLADSIPPLVDSPILRRTRLTLIVFVFFSVQVAIRLSRKSTSVRFCVSSLSRSLARLDSFGTVSSVNAVRRNAHSVARGDDSTRRARCDVDGNAPTTKWLIFEVVDETMRRIWNECGKAGRRIVPRLRRSCRSVS